MENALVTSPTVGDMLLPDPVIRKTGLAVLGAAAAVSGYQRIRHSMVGTSPAETAITSLLPQALNRASLAIHEGSRPMIKALMDASGIDAVKASLRTASSREEKLSLWSEVMLRTYTILIVAPHMFTGLIVAITYRSAIGILAHVQQSAGLRLADSGDYLVSSRASPSSIVATFFKSLFSGGAKTAITDAVMTHLVSMIGTNPFSVDDIDNENSTVLGNKVSPLSFGHADIVDILCDKIPFFMDKARLCLMEELGMISPDALRSVWSATGRGHLAPSPFSPPSNASAPSPSLISPAGEAPLNAVSRAIARSHRTFVRHVLNWRANVWGTSPVLFRELSPSPTNTTHEFDEDHRGVVAEEEEAGAGASSALTARPSPSSRQFDASALMGLAGFQSPADSPQSDAYRAITRRYSQDLLMSDAATTVLRAYGEENFAYWWGVTFFKREIPVEGVALTSSPSLGCSAVAVATSARAKAACKSFDASTTNVRLLEFALSLDKTRQALLIRPFYVEGGEGLPQTLKQFCEEMIRSSRSA